MVDTRGMTMYSVRVHYVTGGAETIRCGELLGNALEIKSLELDNVKVWRIDVQEHNGRGRPRIISKTRRV